MDARLQDLRSRSVAGDRDALARWVVECLRLGRLHAELAGSEAVEVQVRCEDSDRLRAYPQRGWSRSPAIVHYCAHRQVRCRRAEHAWWTLAPCYEGKPRRGDRVDFLAEPLLPHGRGVIVPQPQQKRLEPLVWGLVARSSDGHSAVVRVNDRRVYYHFTIGTDAGAAAWIGNAIVAARWAADGKVCLRRRADQDFAERRQDELRHAERRLSQVLQQEPERGSPRHERWRELLDSAEHVVECARDAAEAARVRGGTETTETTESDKETG